MEKTKFITVKLIGKNLYDILETDMSCSKVIRTVATSFDYEMAERYCIALNAGENIFGGEYD